MGSQRAAGLRPSRHRCSAAFPRAAAGLNLTPIVHRRLSPVSLRVRHNNQPLFTDFNLTRLQDAETISPARVDFGDLLPLVAEEVRQGGLAAADARSDNAALCASLLTLFDPDAPLPIGSARSWNRAASPIPPVDQALRTCPRCSPG